MRRAFFLALLLLVPAARALALDAATLSRKLDELYRSSSSVATATMTVVTPDYERTLKIKSWSKGMDLTLIRILYPPKERGTATLKREGEMWNYLPKIQKTLRVPPSMMLSSWMGSDLTNDDLVRRTSWEKDYTSTLSEDPKTQTALLTYVPKEGAPVTWSKVEGRFDLKSFLPEAIAFYDEKGRKVRVMEFSNVGPLGGRTVPRRITVTPLEEDKKGRKTTIQYDEATFEAGIAADFFNLARLKEAD